MMLQGWRYHIVGGDTMINDMMVSGLAIPTGLRDADIVIFSGGTDISPKLYNDVSHPKTQRSDNERDRVEQAAFQLAVQKKKLCVGICRGAQLLNVLSGGSLYQHVDKHTNTNHKVTYVNESGEKYIVDVTSDHHQMMRTGPSGLTWGWCGLSTVKSTGLNDTIMDKHHSDDPEIVYYKRTNSLCFQPHPEWHLMSCKSLFFDCIKRAMLA
jgi:GMP synthase-like glutamine amidotransferase